MKIYLVATLLNFLVQHHITEQKVCTQSKQTCSYALKFSDFQYDAKTYKLRFQIKHVNKGPCAKLKEGVYEIHFLQSMRMELLNSRYYGVFQSCPR